MTVVNAVQKFRRPPDMTAAFIQIGIRDRHPVLTLIIENRKANFEHRSCVNVLPACP
jgi:hypothetical protein